jgi:tetratricopeptide (TPR) repeat protein
MNSKLNPLRAILLTLLTCLILFLIGAGVLYFRDSYVMREGDIAYNSGDYISALSRYRVLQQVFPFKQEAFQKADYCLYNLGKQAMDNEEWEDAKDYLSQVKAFELDSVNKMMTECDKGIEAEADRARSYDQIFLEDLEKAINWYKVNG